MFNRLRRSLIYCHYSSTMLMIIRIALESFMMDFILYSDFILHSSHPTQQSFMGAQIYIKTMFSTRIFDRIIGRIQIGIWTRCQINDDDSMTINRIPIGRMALMFSFYFTFIVNVSANIWYQ